MSIPSTQAGVQAAAGGLRERGVAYVIHAFGPIWTDYPATAACIPKVTTLIRRTVTRALAAAVRMGCRTCALPAISGGIFTHWSAATNIKEVEQRAARVAVTEAVFEWAKTNSGLTSISMCDLSPKKLGRVNFFLEAFDEIQGQFGLCPLSYLPAAFR